MDVLAVIRAPLEQYPPSVNQVALLAEAGLRVGVVDCRHTDSVPSAFSGPGVVERFQPCNHTQLYKEKQPPIVVRLWRKLAFRWCVSRVIQRRAPKAVIAYDPNAMIAVGPLWHKPQRPRLVWHFHELWLPASKAARTLTDRAIAFACEHAGEVDLVTFPDLTRAEIFAQESRLKTRAIVVMNCPRKMTRIPEDHLSSELSKWGLGGLHPVYFHGWIGPGRWLETVIQSMRWWPERTLFVMVGPVTETYRNSLVALARQVGSEGRLLFLGSVPHDEVFHLAAGAKVGCSLVGDQNDPNWTYSAGAINKRFEFMAVGLTQVANSGLGMREIIEEPDCGMLVDPSSPASVGGAVAALLRDETLRKRMGENGRAAHLAKFNYELQFHPVLEQVARWCGR